MFVCASTECYPGMTIADACQKLVDLEYTAIEIAVHDEDGPIKPSQVHADADAAYEILSKTYRLTVAALSLDIHADGDEYYQQFESCAKLAKAIKVATLIVSSGELGTPFNEEIERLKELSRIASLEGCVVALKTEAGRMSHDPDTAAVFCKHVKGLGITLDPSHFVYQLDQPRSYDTLLPHVQHVHLRDTRKDEFHVRIGQGEVEYNRLITSLQRGGYARALSANIPPLEDVDHDGEMRKLRLLLESFL